MSDKLRRVLDICAQALVPELPHIPEIEETVGFDPEPEEYVLEPDPEFLPDPEAEAVPDTGGSFGGISVLKAARKYAERFNNVLRVETELRKDTLDIYMNRGDVHGTIVVVQRGSDDYEISAEVYIASVGGEDRTLWKINHEGNTNIMGAGGHIAQVIDFVVELITKTAEKRSQTKWKKKFSDESSEFFPGQIREFANKYSDVLVVDVDEYFSADSIYIYFDNHKKHVMGFVDIQKMEDEKYWVYATLSEYNTQGDMIDLWKLEDSGYSGKEVDQMGVFEIIDEVAAHTENPEN